MDGCTVRTVYMWGLSLVWCAGRVLWSECKNPIRSRTPVDQSYGPTSWVFAVCGSKHFLRIPMWILDLLLLLYVCFSAVLVLCRPRVSIVLWCWGCWFCVNEAFLSSGPVVLCVHVSNSWVQAQWRGALIFFEEKMYDAFTKMNGRCV